MGSKAVEIPTYVIASNRLAGEYLVQVLAHDRFVRPILCEQLPQPRIKSVPVIFVIEGSLVPLPWSDCIRRLRFLFPKGRFVIVDRRQLDEEILRLVSLGFQGFVEHSEVADTLADAVHAVAKGRLWISDDLMQRYVNLTAETRHNHAGQPQLPTPRENEVLELVRRRLSNKEIAMILDVSESTVKYHLTHILAKFQVGSRRELETTGVSPPRIWEQLSKARTS